MVVTDRVGGMQLALAVAPHIGLQQAPGRGRVRRQLDAMAGGGEQAVGTLGLDLGDQVARPLPAGAVVVGPQQPGMLGGAAVRIAVGAAVEKAHAGRALGEVQEHRAGHPVHQQAGITDPVTPIQIGHPPQRAPAAALVAAAAHDHIDVAGQVAGIVVPGIPGRHQAAVGGHRQRRDPPGVHTLLAGAGQDLVFEQAGAGAFIGLGGCVGRLRRLRASGQQHAHAGNQRQSHDPGNDSQWKAGGSLHRGHDHQASTRISACSGRLAGPTEIWTSSPNPCRHSIIFSTETPRNTPRRIPETLG